MITCVRHRHNHCVTMARCCGLCGCLDRGGYCDVSVNDDDDDVGARSTQERGRVQSDLELGIDMTSELGSGSSLTSLASPLSVAPVEERHVQLALQRRAMALKRCERDAFGAATLYKDRDGSETYDAVAQSYARRVEPMPPDVREAIAASLSTHFLFSDLTESDLHEFIDSFVPRPVARGALVVQEGSVTSDGNDEFFVIISGELDVMVSGVGVVASLVAGDNFGELALMYDAPRSATVAATTDALLYSINRLEFRYIVIAADLVHLATQETSEWLATVPLLEVLPPRTRAALAERLQRVSFPEARYIFRQGTPGDVMYIVVSGSVVVTTTTPGVKVDVQICELGAGDFFGEGALLTAGGQRSANVVAGPNCVCLAMSKETFDDVLLEPRGGVSEELEAVHAQRVRRSRALAVAPSIPTRLAASGDGGEGSSAAGAVGGVAAAAAAAAAAGAAQGSASSSVELSHLERGGEGSSAAGAVGGVAAAAAAAGAAQGSASSSIELSHLEPIALLSPRTVKGAVFFCRDRAAAADRFVVVEQVCKSAAIQAERASAASCAAEALRALRHPFVESFLATLQDEHSLYFISAADPRDDVLSVLRHGAMRGGAGEVGALTEEARVRVVTFAAACLTSALDYLHRFELVHRNISPQSLLLSTRGCVVRALVRHQIRRRSHARALARSLAQVRSPRRLLPRQAHFDARVHLLRIGADTPPARDDPRQGVRRLRGLVGRRDRTLRAVLGPRNAVRRRRSAAKLQAHP